MCGIVGYVGPKSTQEVLLGGLRRLEYRGYDSAGISVISQGQLATRKKAGKLDNLVADIKAHPIADSRIGIGHTRWATHGAPTDQNAHPHLGGPSSKLALIHNGIIENFSELKQELLDAGTSFASETDSEVAAHLIAKEYEASKDLVSAFGKVVNRLHGAFTILVIHEDFPDLILAARKNAPLVIGLGEGENFLGSDVAAFVEHTKRAISVGQDEIVILRPSGVEIQGFDGHKVDSKEFTIDWDASQASKGGWPSFMAKEIADQPQAVADTLMGRINSEGMVTLPEIDGLDAKELMAIDRIIVVACGTASYAGEIAKYAIEKWAKIPVSVELAHEFRYRDPILTPNTLIVAISQSGETMDTLMATRYAKEQGAKVMAICNTQGATLARESDAVVYTHAGPEVAVASTKALTAQMTAVYLLALFLATGRKSMSASELSELGKELLKLPAKVTEVLSSLEQVSALAKKMSNAKTVLFLGRNVGFPVAMEGALKLKELAYIHAEGFAAGELKHGPIALIEQDQPVIVILPSPKDPLHPKVISNIQEIKARGATVIAIAEVGDKEASKYAENVWFVPATNWLMAPVLTVIPLQAFAMELANAKGLDVDQPRNLAKSVTVE
ncbi:MAG: glutamine--fructose-6-phosphate transaminase (isomerizing) [Actinobacteria bacterium]|uniref:Glutamine--fructose-6-phosphate aminotransferase [isomerizing] n=1 Tax=freshwater metagenome TaxID=449393 RepID=A0A6J6JQJ3_9ZZZZ|nr:glutamine--fructose-6-phosphate transaminase (isomerizing) [Actinomycetota bacterium]